MTQRGGPTFKAKNQKKSHGPNAQCIAIKPGPIGKKGEQDHRTFLGVLLLNLCAICLDGSHGNLEAFYNHGLCILRYNSQ